MIDKIIPKCPTCNGSKWVRGMIGGIYDCPDCWAHEQKFEIDNNPALFEKQFESIDANEFAKSLDNKIIKTKRKYVKKEKC